MTSNKPWKDYPVGDLPGFVRLQVVPADEHTRIICSNNNFYDPSEYDPTPVVQGLMAQGDVLAHRISDTGMVNPQTPYIALPDGGIPLMKAILRTLPNIERQYTEARGRVGETINMVRDQNLPRKAALAGGLVIVDDHIKNGRQMKQMLEKFERYDFPLLLVANFVRGESLQLQAEAAEDYEGPVETLGKYLADRPNLASRVQIVTSCCYQGKFPPFIKKCAGEEHDLGDLVRGVMQQPTDLGRMLKSKSRHAAKHAEPEQRLF